MITIFLLLLHGSAGAIITSLSPGSLESMSDSALDGVDPSPPRALQERDRDSNILHCIKRWSEYDSSTSAAVEICTTSVEQSWVDTTTLALGTAEVYNTTDGIPVASGNFTATKIITTTFWRTSTSLSWYPETTGKLPKATPRCRSRPYSERSEFCDSYLSGLGFRRDTTMITPSVSFDSSACPLPVRSCSIYTESYSGCFLGGRNVQLFYFLSFADSPGMVVYHSYADGITFTSPSVYLSFDYLTATSMGPFMGSGCSMCNYGACEGIDGGHQSMIPVGTTMSNQLIAVPPSHLSSMIVAAEPQDEATIVDMLAHFSPGQSNFNYSSFEEFREGRFNTQLVELADLAQPPPIAYYLNPAGAPGCGEWYQSDGEEPGLECSTIFKDLYRPYIAIPSELAALQGLWESCQATAGVTATPVALTRFSASVIIATTTFANETGPHLDLPSCLKRVSRAGHHKCLKVHKRQEDYEGNNGRVAAIREVGAATVTSEDPNFTPTLVQPAHTLELPQKTSPHDIVNPTESSIPGANGLYSAKSEASTNSRLGRRVTIVLISLGVLDLCWW